MLLDERDKTNISREISIIKKIRHPNITQLYQVIETPQKIYLAMEHISGGELYKMIITS